MDGKINHLFVNNERSDNLLKFYLFPGTLSSSFIKLTQVVFARKSTVNFPENMHPNLLVTNRGRDIFARKYIKLHCIDTFFFLSHYSPMSHWWQNKETEIDRFRIGQILSKLGLLCETCSLFITFASMSNNAESTRSLCKGSQICLFMDCETFLTALCYFMRNIWRVI